ncbi:unnamed protein product [Amoebophrya sp. A25]|nr:unnamed protein product [Amoebophrya sp. A25]|eukprot:GSA25T00014228001.1
MYSSRPTDRLRRRAQLSASWSFSNDCGDYSIFGSALSTSPRPTRPSFFKLGGCLANRVRRSGLLCGASTIASASIANNIKQNEDHSKTNRQDHERATRSPAIVGQDVQQQQCFVTASSSSCSYETTTGENEYEWQQSATSNKSASCAGRDNSVEQEHHVDVSFLSASALLELTPRSRARRLAFQHRAEKSGLLASDTRRTRLRRRGGALVRTSKRVRLNRASPSRYLLWTTAFLPGMQAEELKRHASCFERNLYQPERGDCIYLSQPSLLENSTSDMLKDPPTPQERPASFPSGETTNKNSLHVLAAYNSPSSKTKSAMLGNGKKEDGTGQTTTIIAFKDTRLRTPKKVFKISTIDDVLPASKEAPNELRHKCKTGSASSPKNVKARTSSTTRSNRRPLHGKAVAEVGSKKADKGNPHLAQKADAVLVVPTAPAVVNDEHKMALLADELVGYVKNREAPRNASSGLKQSNASQSKKQLLSSVSDFLLQRAARAEDMLYQLIFQVCAQLPELTDVPDIEGNHIAANGELTSGLHGEISSTRLNGFLTQLIDKLAHVQVLPEDRVCHLRELLYRHPSALSRPPSVAPLDLTENEADHHGDHMDGQLIVSAPGLFSVPNKANNDDALVHMEPGPELSTSLIVEENEADEKIGQSELTLTDALQVACGGTAVDEDVKARTMTTSPSSPPLAPINPINMATFMGTAEQVQVEQAPSTTFKNDNRVNSVGGVATHMKEMKDHHGGSDEDPSSILMQEDSVLPSLDEVDNYLASGSEEDGFSRNGRTPAEIADGGDGSADPLRTSKIALSPTNGTCTSKGNGRLRGENTEATSENVQEDVVLVNEEAQEKLVRRAQLQNQDEVLPSRSGTNAGLNQGNQDAGWLVPALAPQEPWMPRTVNTDELLQAEEEQNVEQAFIDQVEQIPVIDSEKASVDDVRTRTFSFRPCSTGRGSLIDVVAVPGDADSACKIADGVASNIFNTTEIAASAHVQSQPHNGELEDAFDEISLSRPRWPRDVATPHEMAQRTGSLSSAAATPTFAFRVDDRASQNTGELGGVTTAALLATIGKKLPDDVPPHAAGVNKDRVTTAALPVSTCFVGSSRDRSKFRTINATANPDAGKHNRATDDADGAEPQPLPEVETAAQRPQTQKKEATKDPMTPTCNVKDVVQTSVATPDDKEPRMVTPNLSSIQRYSTPGCGAVALSSSNGTSVSQGTLGAVSGSQRRIGHRDGMLDQHAEMAARFSVLAAQQLQEENSSTRAAGAEQEVTVRTTTNMGVLPTATTMPTHVHVEVDQHRLSSLPARAMHLMGEPRRHEQEQEEEDIKLDYLEAVRKSEEREEQFAMQLDENRKVPTRPTARTTASGSITTSCGRTTAGSLCSPLEIRHTELITNIRVPEARGRETTQFVAPAFPATNDLSEKVMPATKMEDVGKVDSGEKTEDLQNVYGQDFGADHVFVGRESVARPSQSIVLPKKAEGRCAFFSFDSAHDHPTAPAVGSSSTTQKNGDFGMDDVPAYEAVVRTIANAELRRFFGGDSGSDVEHAVQVCKATATSPLQKVNAVGAIGDENQNMESQSADVCAPGGFVHSTTTSQAFFRSSIPGRVTRHTVAARTRFLEPPRAVADQTRSSVTPSPSLRAHDKSPQTRDRTPQFLLSPRGFNKICEQSMSPSRNGRALMAPASTAVRPSGSRVGVCKSGASRVDKSVTSRNAFAYSPRPRPNLFHEHHITIPEKHFFETKPAPLPLVDAASQAADPLLRSAPQTKTNVTRAPGGALNQLRSPRGASSIYASNLYEHQHQTNSTSLGRNQGSRAAPFRLLSPRSPSVYQNQREKRPYANQQADITLLPASEAGTSYENETDEIRLLIRRAAAACAANVGAADQMDIAKPVEAAALTSDIRTAKMRRYAGIENDHQDVPTRSSTLAQNQQARIPRACRSFFPPFQREVNRRVAAAQYTGEVSCGNDSGDVTTMPLLPHPVIARYPTSPEKYFDYQQKMSSQENVEDREPCQSHSVHPKREHDQQHTQHPYTTSVPVRLCAAAAPPPSEGGVEMTNTASVVRKAPRIWPLPPAHTDSLIGWAADFRSRSLSRPKPLLGQQQETVGVRDSSGFPRASCSTATQRLLPAEAPMICEKTRYGSAPIGGGNYRPSTARASQPPVGSISLENKFKPAPLRAKIKPVDLMAGVPFTLDLSQPQNLLSSCFLGLPDAGANVVEDSRSPHQEDGDAPGGALIAEVDSGAAAFATEQRAPHLDDSLTEVEVLRSPGCWKPDPEVEAAKSSSQIISDKGEPEPMEYNLLDHRISFADDVVEERDKVQQAREPLSGTPAPGLEGNIIASSSSSSSRGSIYACGEEDDPAA